METKNLLSALIEDFSSENLIQLFRQKTRTFRQIDEEAKQLNNDFFSDALLLGEIKLKNEGELIIYTFKTTKALTERSGKKAQYNLAKKILKQEQRYTAGFFIFYDDNNNFRFSLVYDIPQPNGKREWSNFKRFTYYVSKDQTNKTFLDRLDAADFSSLEKIKEAFSVDKVTEDFYREISYWYFWALDEVEFPDDEDKNSEQRNAKNLIRLITRIIFVWFMKEKKLVPPALFDKPEIDKIINYKDETGSTYYKAILQNLFFATLNTKMKSDDTDSRIFVDEAKKKGFWNDGYLQQGYYRYSRFIKNKDAFLNLFENIPFLNGGLFESLDKKIDGKEIRIDCFSDNPKNEKRLKVPDKLFFLEDEIKVDLSNHLSSGTNKKVKGLLPILKSYNFTIDENTPVDEEVALDPELLGKVFEKLLASYNPETATTARKSSGSYYTPREIVEYMVNESLVEYLKTDLVIDDDKVESKIRDLFDYNKEGNPFNDDGETTEKIIDAIEKVKILDPACGSGAFPMGILHKLVLALHKLDPDNKIWKKRLIERVPAEIRTETEKSLQNKPLDYIRKLGLIENCIYGVDIQEIAIQISKLRFFISLLVEQEIDDTKHNRDVRSLPNLETKFVAANTLIGLEKPEQLGFVSNEVEELEKQLFKKRKDLFYANSRTEKLKLQKEEKKLREELKAALQQSDFKRDVAAKISDWDPFDQNRHADWFDPEWMFGVRDGFDVVIGNPPYVKEYTSRKAFDGLRASPYYMGKMDIWYMFTCSGIDLLNNKGVITFIAQNNWVTSYGAKIMRNQVLTKTKILQLIDFGNYKIFENAGIQTMIMIFKRVIKTPDQYFVDVRILREHKKISDSDIFAILAKHDKDSNLLLKSNLKPVELFDETITFNESEIDKILNKMKSRTNFLLDSKFEIAQGIVFPQDFLNKKNKKFLGDSFEVGQGIFVLNDLEKEEMRLTKLEESLIKPYYTASELKRYYRLAKNKYWTIYTDSKFKDSALIENYPNIKAHLDQFKRIITSDNKPYGIHRARDERFFKGEKITSLRKCIVPTFSFSDFDCYVSAAFYVIKSNRIDLKYLTGLLNSNLITFWLKNKGKMQGNIFQIDKEPLLHLPLFKPSVDEQKSIRNIVEKIINEKKQDSQADTKHLEDQIDIMVYKLYNLTYEEVEIIDPEIGSIINKEDYEKFELQ